MTQGTRALLGPPAAFRGGLSNASVSPSAVTADAAPASRRPRTPLASGDGPALPIEPGDALELPGPTRGRPEVTCRRGERAREVWAGFRDVLHVPDARPCTEDVIRAYSRRSAARPLDGRLLTNKLYSVEDIRQVLVHFADTDALFADAGRVRVLEQLVLRCPAPKNHLLPLLECFSPETKPLARAVLSARPPARRLASLFEESHESAFRRIFDMWAFRSTTIRGAHLVDAVVGRRRFDSVQLRELLAPFAPSKRFERLELLWTHWDGEDAQTVLAGLPEADRERAAKLLSSPPDEGAFQKFQRARDLHEDIRHVGYRLSREAVNPPERYPSPGDAFELRVCLAAVPPDRRLELLSRLRRPPGTWRGDIAGTLEALFPDARELREAQRLCGIASAIASEPETVSSIGSLVRDVLGRLRR